MKQVFKPYKLQKLCTATKLPATVRLVTAAISGVKMPGVALGYWKQIVAVN